MTFANEQVEMGVREECERSERGVRERERTGCAGEECEAMEKMNWNNDLAAFRLVTQWERITCAVNFCVPFSSLAHVALRCFFTVNLKLSRTLIMLLADENAK